jgi:uncharacterized coiled-coil protein SlyX
MEALQAQLVAKDARIAELEQLVAKLTAQVATSSKQVEVLTEKFEDGGPREGGRARWMGSSVSALSSWPVSGSRSGTARRPAQLPVSSPRPAG